MKDVSRDDDQIRLLLEQVVHGAAKHFRDVRLALIGALRRLAIELPEAEVQAREVGELPFASTSRIEFCVSCAMSFAAIPSAGAEMFMASVPCIPRPTP